MMKLHNKVLGMMLLISVVPLSLLGVISLFSLNLFHKIDVASIEKNLLEQKSEEIENFVREIIDTFEIRVSFEQRSDIELESQKFLLRQLLEEFPNLEEAAFINLLGDETTRFSRDFPEGVPPEEFQNQSRIQKFITAKTGVKFVSPVHFTLKGPIITVASPVLNRNNEIISILSGQLNLSPLESILEKARLGGSGYVYLTDGDGFIIASGDQNRKTSASLKSQLPLVTETLENQIQPDLQNQKRYESVWGEKVVAAGKYLPSLKWGLFAEWPRSDADKVVSVIRDQIISAILLVIVFAVILSFLLANKIVKPVKKLEDGAKLIAEGKFDNPVEIKTGDEIENLGKAFNDMMKGLKRLQELKDEFVFIAAHELRTPVTAIKGYISMIIDGSFGPVGDQVKKNLDQVKTASDRLNNLVNDLLQIARSEAGRLEIKVAPTDVSESVKAVLNELQPLAVEKSITLVYAPPHLPKAMADPARLKEVLVNLIGNAVKYTIGSGTVTITHETKDKEIITHIKDTGIGMSKDAQAKLFEKFYRVQTEETKNITGTGLGLFIVKQIIEKMNGKIWVESKEKKGSTFSFSLPTAIG